MQFEIKRHEKVRFRREDLTCLETLPSATAVSRGRRVARWISRVAYLTALSVAGAIGLFVLAAIVVVNTGVGQDRVRMEAQTVMSRLVGPDFAAAIGSVGLTFMGPTSLAIAAHDVRVARAEDAAVLMDADTVALTVSMPALLAGELRLTGVAVEGGRLHMSALPSDSPPRELLTSDGLIDPDAVTSAAFDAIARWNGDWSRRGAGPITLTNISLVWADTVSSTVTINRAKLTPTGDGEAAMVADLSTGGYQVDLNASLAADPRSHLVQHLGIEAVARAINATADDQTNGFAVLRVQLEGVPGTSGTDLSLHLNAEGLTVDAGVDAVRGDLSLSARLADGADKIEIDRLQTSVGRSKWTFHGAIGLSPVVPSTDATYRFELVSDGSTVAPAGSQEASLNVLARLAGTVDARMRRFEITEIGLRTGAGEARGSATVQFGDNGAPGLELRLDVTGMPVGRAKQLWPWFAAPSSRRWVNDNLFGGMVTSGWLQLAVAAGRLGNGIPLNREEVAGEFQVERTRFDIAGRLPPVRDGAGRVAFAGSDVDISLDRGTVYLPGGRSVDAANGRLAVGDAHLKPVVGRLEIDVVGAADAVLELASYDPINVERHVDIVPDALSGRVTGHVSADVPMHDGIPEDTLNWLVSLSYDDLAIAVPVNGQQIAQASGTIIVDPDKAVIEASARLNGSPATLSLVEPLGDSDVERSRRIALSLDDKAREALTPGLDMLVSGSVDVELEDPGVSTQRIDADLSKAGLAIPWVGWSKGPGIPASLSFELRKDGDRTELADFRLTGESFAASGSVTMSGERLDAINFPAVRLARNDDFSIELRRREQGYAVTVRGRSIDARSLIKLYGGRAEGNGGGDAVPLVVDLRVDTVVGFHGETLRDVSLQYAGNGSRADNVSFTATTAGGARLLLADSRDGDGRTMTIESADAGALLRFLDLYERVRGGSITLTLRGPGDGRQLGRIDARDFSIVDEPRLARLVSTPSTADGRSLNQAVRGNLDTSVVRFERGFAEIIRSAGTVALQQGVLRGPMIGVTFQGQLHDPQGNMNLTGTFMPAYGLNRLFGEIPLFGALLGNGRDRGLIGITFRLSGQAAEPSLDINPLSVIAPGIFRSVFEFR